MTWRATPTPDASCLRCGWMDLAMRAPRLQRRRRGPERDAGAARSSEPVYAGKSQSVRARPLVRGALASFGMLEGERMKPHHFTRTPRPALIELPTRAAPPEAHTVPSSPYRPVLGLTSSVKPAASSVLVPPMGVPIGVIAARFTKSGNDVPHFLAARGGRSSGECTCSE